MLNQHQSFTRLHELLWLDFASLVCLLGKHNQIRLSEVLELFQSAPELVATSLGGSRSVLERCVPLRCQLLSLLRLLGRLLQDGYLVGLSLAVVGKVLVQAAFSVLL